MDLTVFYNSSSMDGTSQCIDFVILCAKMLIESPPSVFIFIPGVKIALFELPYPSQYENCYYLIVFVY